VAGNDKESTLICFASKSLNAGQVTSKMHVIELGAQPGISMARSLYRLSIYYQPVEAFLRIDMNNVNLCNLLCHHL